MKAEEVSIGELFRSGQQLLVPIWQRRYSWDRQDWTELWGDLQRLREGSASSHFLGSFVLSKLPYSGLPSEAKRFWVVDGQQRVATLTVLVTVLRDRLASFTATDADRTAKRDEYTRQLLRNADLQDGHQARLVLQEPDDSRLRLMVSAGRDETADSSIDNAYTFFYSATEGCTQDELSGLLTIVLTRLEGVWVILEEGDNAHRVFQTLNAGGKPLRQSDLVRNYFFLLLGDRGNQFYEDHWSDLEEELSTKELDDYFVAWTISQGHTGGRQSLFRYFQSDLRNHEEQPDEVEEYGLRLTSTSPLFLRLRREPQPAPQPLERVLRDLYFWGTAPAEGLLLHLLRQRKADRLDDVQLALALECVLSFMARRFVAGYEPNLHKSILVAATHRLLDHPNLDGENTVALLRFVLSRGVDVRTWPTDDQIQDRAESTPLYTSSRANWAFSVLERANRASYAMAQQAPLDLPRSQFTVEHVMPQTLTEEWENDLESWGVESPTRLHQTKLHVLGNLSLSPINSTLSNKRLSEKRGLIQHDYLRLNLDLADVPAWTETIINERSKDLAERICRAYIKPLSQEEIEASPFSGDIALAEVADEASDEDEDE